jgi:hypothetical protein
VVTRLIDEGNGRRFLQCIYRTVVANEYVDVSCNTGFFPLIVSIFFFFPLIRNVKEHQNGLFCSRNSTIGSRGKQ